MAKSQTLKNPRHELFCQKFVRDEEILGNGTKVYADIYGIDLTKKGGYAVASAGASYLLRKINISNRISEILNLVMTDATVDNELNYVITQKSDLGAKVSAMREYNKLKKRVSDININNDVKILVLPAQVIAKNKLEISNAKMIDNAKPILNTNSSTGDSNGRPS